MPNNTGKTNKPTRREFMTHGLALAGGIATTAQKESETPSLTRPREKGAQGPRSYPQLTWKPITRGAQANEIPELDPPLRPREEAMFFLHVAAGVEHALMAQYLYAAYSLKSSNQVLQETGDIEKSRLVNSWRNTLLQISREEMGHLLTVQNLLLLLGGPVNLAREDFPFRSDLYPFHFRLEPLSRDALAKYLVAEHPLKPPIDMQKIVERAKRADGVEGVSLHRVGRIYQRLRQIFAELDTKDFVANPGDRQALGRDWRADRRILIPPVTNTEEALTAIDQIAQQGEGPEQTGELPSHFDRFLSIYQTFPEDEWQPARSVPRNPVIGDDPGLPSEKTYISHPRAKKWAQLCDFRYRMLLSYLVHFLLLEGPVSSESDTLTARGYLNRWTFHEMIHGLGRTAAKLTLLPRDNPPVEHQVAGPPFTLPYTLQLPGQDVDRWRVEVDVIDASTDLINKIMKEHPEDNNDPILRELLAHNSRMRQEMMQWITGV